MHILLSKEITIQFYNYSKLGYNDIELRIKWMELIETEGITKEQQLKELVPIS